MMEWIIENWSLVVMGFAGVVALGGSAIRFVKSPTDKKYKSVRQWLLYAVVEAEVAFGSKTGQLKLRYVYNLFITRFKWLSLVISFEQFSKMVDSALDELKEVLENEEAIKKYIEGGE